MRRIRYQVACSLDGFIAGPEGETDWIPAEPEIDFDALFAQFDTLIMGRRTFLELPGGAAGYPDHRIIVFSRTLRQEDHPDVEIVAEATTERLDALRWEDGKDVWLFGGGALFGSLLELGCVDTVEPAVIPVVLGAGRPMLPGPASRQKLRLTRTQVYDASGIVLLEYDVDGRGGANDARERI